MKKHKLSFIVIVLVLCLVGSTVIGCTQKGTDDDDGAITNNEISETIKQDKDEIRILTENLKANMPKTDGSTSTLPLDIAVHSEILGISEEEATLLVSHSKTYTSLENLVAGKCDLIIRTPMSDNEIEYLSQNNFSHKAEPVSSEGFVFVVNQNNPVDSLTVEQLKDIYSGKITNWRALGGNDLPIIPYQRNADSGSQNYMISFMGDAPLMEPVTEALPATMSGILDAIANYDNAEGAIGYSVYAYSDGMYEDMAKIKYIKVNGVEPSLKSISDGSYSLVGYNYAIFNAEEPDDSPARMLVKWMQSDVGQKVIAEAGYVPYRNIEGLTLPAGSMDIYNAKGSGEALGDEDYYYELRELCEIKDSHVNKIITDYIAAEKQRVEQIDENEIKSFLSARSEYAYDYSRIVNTSIVNGYLSVFSGITYYRGDDSPTYYYSPKGAVFDLYTGEKLAFDELFPEGYDFVPTLNDYIRDQSQTPYSGSGRKYEMAQDFTVLKKGSFTYTAEQIIFYPGKTFMDGVALSLEPLRDIMSVSGARDMEEIFELGDNYIYRVVYNYSSYSRWGILTAVQFPNGNADDKLTVWMLDEKKAPLPHEVTEKVNSGILEICGKYLAPEKLLEQAAKNGIATENIEKYYIGPFPDYYVTLCGKRYIEFAGAGRLFVETNDDKFHEMEIPLNCDMYTIRSYFSAETGEKLTLDELFDAGYEEYAGAYTSDAVICDIKDYDRAPYATGRKEDDDIPVKVSFVLKDEVHTVNIPRKYIK